MGTLFDDDTQAPNFSTQHGLLPISVLDSVLGSLPVGILIAEAPGGRLITSNRRLKEILRRPEFPSASVQPGSDWLASHPDGRPYTAEEWPLTRMLETGVAVRNEEVRIVRGDGTLGAVLLSTSPLSDAAGNRVAAMLSCEDITPLRNAEAELQHLALDKTRELYTISQNIGLVNTPKDALDVLLSSSYLKNSYRACVCVFDHPWTQLNGPPNRLDTIADWTNDARSANESCYDYSQDIEWLSASNLRDHPIYIEDIDAGTGLHDNLRAHLHENGVRSLTMFPLMTSGEWYGILAIYFNRPGMVNNDEIHFIRGLVDQVAAAVHIMRLLKTEAEARQEAERANELKLKFLAMISHELRTPLTSIKGFTTTLLADDVSWDTESQRDFLNTINDEADKLTDMIEQLLDLSRLEAGTLRIQPTPQPMIDIIATADTQLRTVTETHHLHIDAPKALPLVRADRQRIAQVLVNLVENSAKYSPHKTDITVTARRIDAFVQVDVSDQGSGIPVAERKLMFEAFQRGTSEKHRRVRGVGLGLAICKALIEAHGGRIWVQDREGPGTTISFTLPVVA